MGKLRWGIIGTGGIARTFARALGQSSTGVLVAVGSRSKERAERFCQEFGVGRAHASYEALLADPEVDAVYISTPHPMHAEWAIRAAEAGKHILCEKPLTLNHAEAMVVVEAAHEHGVFLMEAFMYRCHPQTAKLVELLRERAIGDVRVIQATFSFHSARNLEGRLLKKALGGGGILDVGCYCTSMARLVAGAATGKDFAEPLEVKGCARIGPDSGVDEWAVASLRFPGDILAELATGVQLEQENVVRIFGSEGSILVPSPWGPARDGGSSKIIVNRRGEKTPREVVVQADRPLYTIEADTVAANIDRREAPSPAMTWADTLGNMKTLDRWRESIGLVYDSEGPDAIPAPVGGRPLAVRAGNRMKYGRIPGVEKRISRVVMGVMGHQVPHVTAMFDDFFARGGNCFDTAYIYGGGKCDSVLGRWVEARGLRDQVVILAKGAHTPFCNPRDLTSQLLESLDRLRTDYADIYMMHRDNPDIPVGEFVDCLNEHLRQGRIKAFGGSNWSLRRVEEANEYARRKGLVGFAAVSNNFSLARMIAPPWDGCISSSDAESREWFRRTQMPLMAWSSQAQGFFGGRARPDDLSDGNLVRCWYSDDNFRRLERAAELARRRGVPTPAVALAYVLCQPFPTFALIGPQKIEETRTSLQALELELSPEELRWLNLED